MVVMCTSNRPPVPAGPACSLLGLNFFSHPPPHTSTALHPSSSMSPATDTLLHHITSTSSLVQDPKRFLGPRTYTSQNNTFMLQVLKLPHVPFWHILCLAPSFFFLYPTWLHPLPPLPRPARARAHRFFCCRWRAVTSDLLSFSNCNAKGCPRPLPPPTPCTLPRPFFFPALSFPSFSSRHCSCLETSRPRRQQRKQQRS